MKYCFESTLYIVYQTHIRINFLSLFRAVCRTVDLYLDSTIGSGLKKERPKLNLTVKKELKGLGGKIIAQSGMAKGPDGTDGFQIGWTTRVSQFFPLVAESEKEVCEEQNTIQAHESSDADNEKPLRSESVSVDEENKEANDDNSTFIEKELSLE